MPGTYGTCFAGNVTAATATDGSTSLVDTVATLKLR